METLVSAPSWPGTAAVLVAAVLAVLLYAAYGIVWRPWNSPTPAMTRSETR